MPHESYAAEAVDPVPDPVPDSLPDPNDFAPAPVAGETSPPSPNNRSAVIGARLRQMFDDAVTEPMPPTFEDLLRRLE